MARPQEKLKELYTYEDYLTWDDDVRYELIDGVPYALAAPSPIHQDICRELSLIIGNFLKGKSCKMYFAPIDIRLNADTDDSDVFQPDIVVICDKTKFDKQSYNGTPDFIIEITSPSTNRRDRFVKYHKYLQAKVPEYWIIDPDNRTVSVFILENGRYMHSIFGGTEKLISSVLDGCEIDLAEVFASIDIYEDKD
ncbi:MAG: Uma2 family endonuclease [Candidatus Cloacimonetes bacterium]|nr:Uma2 family endonuclease [Candidatus Cloacimonadota bacterium]